MAKRLLKHVEVAAAIQAGKVGIRERSEVTVDDIVAGLLAVATDKEDGTPSSRAAAWSHLA